MDARAAKDREAIKRVLEVYLEAVRTPGSDLWWQAFHPQATVVNNSRGTDDLDVWTIENFVERVERLRARVGVVEEAVRRMTIDLARHVASVRLDFTLRLGDETYEGTDFFSLARAGGKWVITHKHYDGDRPL